MLKPFQGLKQLFQAIDLYLIYSGQQHAQLSFGKPFPVEPFQVGYGQVA